MRTAASCSPSTPSSAVWSRCRSASVMVILHPSFDLRQGDPSRSPRVREPTARTEARRDGCRLLAGDLCLEGGEALVERRAAGSTRPGRRAPARRRRGGRRRRPCRGWSASCGAPARGGRRRLGRPARRRWAAAASSSTHRHTSPARSAASPSSTSPNTTAAMVAWGPGDAPEHPGVAAAGVQPELEEPGVEPGPPAGEAQVAHQGQVHAGPDGGAVDRGDGRQRAAADPQEPLVDRRQPLAGVAVVARARRGATGRRRRRTPAGRR